MNGTDAEAAFNALAKLLAHAIADEVLRRLRSGDREGMISQEKARLDAGSISISRAN